MNLKEQTLKAIEDYRGGTTTLDELNKVLKWQKAVILCKTDKEITKDKIVIKSAITDDYYGLLIIYYVIGDPGYRSRWFMPFDRFWNTLLESDDYITPLYTKFKLLWELQHILLNIINFPMVIYSHIKVELAYRKQRNK
jgi:hypothetical protein